MDITRYTLPAAVPAPLRAAVVADLHDEPYEPVLWALLRLKPDLVLVPGDCVHSADRLTRGLAFLKAAARRFPVFCSLGNHEVACGPALRPLLRHTGAVLLDNEAALFRGLRVGGLTSGFDDTVQHTLRATPAPDTAFLRRFAAGGGVSLLLCHHPEYYPAYIRPLPVTLTLAGHAHGGQWRWGRQGIFAPGQGLFPRLTAGLHENRLLISRGLGNPCGIPRFGNPPELVLLELRPGGQAV